MLDDDWEGEEKDIGLKPCGRALLGVVVKVRWEAVVVVEVGRMVSGREDWRRAGRPKRAEVRKRDVS